MSDTCVNKKCGCNPQEPPDEDSLTLAECDRCGWMCEECLREAALATGLMSENDANLVHDVLGADGYIMETESGDAKLCPDCFVALEGV